MYFRLMSTRIVRMKPSDHGYLPPEVWLELSTEIEIERTKSRDQTLPPSTAVKKVLIQKLRAATKASVEKHLQLKLTETPNDPNHLKVYCFRTAPRPKRAATPYLWKVVDHLNGQLSDAQLKLIRETFDSEKAPSLWSLHNVYKTIKLIEDEIMVPTSYDRPYHKPEAKNFGVHIQKSRRPGVDQAYIPASRCVRKDVHIRRTAVGMRKRRSDAAGPDSSLQTLAPRASPISQSQRGTASLLNSIMELDRILVSKAEWEMGFDEEYTSLPKVTKDAIAGFTTDLLGESFDPTNDSDLFAKTFYETYNAIN